MRQSTHQKALLIGASLAALALAALLTERQLLPSNGSDRLFEKDVPLESTVSIGARAEPSGGDDESRREDTSVPESPVSEGAPSDEGRYSWREDYVRADDLFAFSMRATKAAMAGDSRAQYYLSQALRTCHIETGPIKLSGLGVEEYLQQLFAELPYSPPNQIINARQRIARCERFLSAESLSRESIPPNPEDHEYWLDQAIAAGDSMALMERSNIAAADLSDVDAEAAQLVKAQALSAVRVAIASKAPEAIAAVGELFWSADVARDHSYQGPAWILAACELGYDCTAANPDFMLLNCDYQVACPTLQDVLMRDFGADYGRIYAASQDIAYKLRVGDWDGLQQYLEMK